MKKDKTDDIILNILNSDIINIKKIEKELTYCLIKEVSSALNDYEEYKELNKEDAEHVFEMVLDDTRQELNI